MEAYEDWNEQVMDLYGAGDYAAALDLLRAGEDRFPEHRGETLYLQSCMAARTGQPQVAIDILRQVRDSGGWYSEFMMLQTPSWQPLQNDPDFLALLKEFKARQAAETAATPRLLVREPKDGCLEEQRCPTLIALHGNPGTAEASLEGWGSVTGAGWLLAAVQSSLTTMKDTFVWGDQEAALKDVAEGYTSLTAQYPVNESRVILGGFSMGGEIALTAALLGTIPAAGFILLGPGGPTVDEPEAFLPMIEEAQRGGLRGLRGYILMGSNDKAILPAAVSRLHEILNSHDIPCGLEVIPGIRHEYPADFGDYLRRALLFIEGGLPDK